MEERFRRMVDGSPAILWVQDEFSGKMVYANKSLEEALGYPLARFVERPTFWFELIHPHDRPMVSALNLEMRDNKTLIRYRARFQNAEGRYVWLATSVKPILDDRGKIVRVEGAAVPTGEEDEK